MNSSCTEICPGIWVGSVSFGPSLRLIHWMNHTPDASEDGRETDRVQRAQRGDREAFDRLAGHYRASLLALAFFRTSNLEAAEDLVQEVLTRAWQKLPTLEEPASFAPWLRTIVANACR